MKIWGVEKDAITKSAQDTTVLNRKEEHKKEKLWSNVRTVQLLILHATTVSRQVTSRKVA